MASSRRQIWAERLGIVHPLPFSGVIFREIKHLATILIFCSNQRKKVQIIKHKWTPEIYKIKLYCIVIILYRIHTKKTKKTDPSKSSCNPLDVIIVSHVYKTPLPLPKFRLSSQLESIRFKDRLQSHLRMHEDSCVLFTSRSCG